MSVSRLVVLWSDPVERRRRPIGHLWHEEDQGYGFGYLPDLKLALSEGFKLPVEFPDHSRGLENPYRAQHLFATFFERIPSPKRPDYHKILMSWGVPETVREKLEILSFSGGITTGDRLEVAEFREPSEGLKQPLRFRLAGTSFNPASAALAEKMKLQLRAQPENPMDAHAVEILFQDQRVGYVPQIYADLMTRVLRGGAVVHLRVLRQLLVPADRGRWVLEATRLG